MSLLLDKLPAQHNGFFINTDFRVSVMFELLMQDMAISDENKILTAFRLYFDNYTGNLEKAFKNYSSACETMIWFYTCNTDVKQTTKKGANNTKAIYSYEFDDKYIYSAFLEQYGIDLTETDMHWWKFKALFSSLSEDTKFVQIMRYRATDLSKIKSKEEKDFYKKMKKLYALPDMRTQEQKEKDFGAMLW